MNLAKVQVPDPNKWTFFANKLQVGIKSVHSHTDGKWISLNWQIWSLFKPTYHQGRKKMQTCISLASNSRNLLHRFCAYATSYIKLSKYHLTSGTKIAMRNVEGIRLWIGTNSFKWTYLTEKWNNVDAYSIMSL